MQGPFYFFSFPFHSIFSHALTLSRTHSLHFIRIVWFREHHEIHTLQIGSKRNNKTWKHIFQNSWSSWVVLLKCLYLYISIRARLVFSLIRAHIFIYIQMHIINFQCVFSPKTKIGATNVYTQRNYYSHMICIESYAQTVIHKVNKFSKNKQRAVAECSRKN